MANRKSVFPVLISLFLTSLSVPNAWSAPSAGKSTQLDNDEFVHHGFQGETSPDTASTPPLAYDTNNPLLAIGSAACAPFRATHGSCLNYLEVDAYIALGDSISIDETRAFAKLHPWKDTAYRDRVIEKEVTTFEGLKSVLTDLVQDCYVLRHVFISSHGFKNHVVFHDGDDVVTERPTVEKVLTASGLACALAPFARVQFDGCSIACQDSSSNGASDLRSVLTSISANPGYSRIPGMSPFSGIQFLFNSDEGTSDPAIYNLLRGKGWHLNRGIHADDNSAILYKILGKTVETDVPVSTARACD